MSHPDYTQYTIIRSEIVRVVYMRLFLYMCSIYMVPLVLLLLHIPLDVGVAKRFIREWSPAVQCTPKCLCLYLGRTQVLSKAEESTHPKSKSKDKDKYHRGEHLYVWLLLLLAPLVVLWCLVRV